MSPSHSCTLRVWQYQQGWSKLSGIKASMDLSLLEWFGVEELSPQMMSNAENFLVYGLKKTDWSTSDKHRYEQYHNSKKELDFNQLVGYSTTLQEHIKQAYLQCKMWLQALTPAVIKPDPCHYGYSNICWNYTWDTASTMQARWPAPSMQMPNIMY